MLWHGYALTQIGYMTKNRIYGCDSLHTTRETIKIKLLNFFENFWGPKLKIWFIEILPIVERNILTKFGEDPLKTVGGVSSRSAKNRKNLSFKFLKKFWNPKLKIGLLEALPIG